MREVWLREQPDRLKQFNLPYPMGLTEWLNRLKESQSFYAHVVLRDTHRPWGQEAGLFSLLGPRLRARRWVRKRLGLPSFWPDDAYCARRAALEQPDRFAALRRAGLARSDQIVASIFEATRDVSDVTYVVYSNHGEVFDHFRYNTTYRTWTVNGLDLVVGTSHGAHPYEVLYANMQMWIIPGLPPRVVQGIGRSIDFAPTALELAGIDSNDMDGESMLQHFVDGAFPVRDRYAETPIRGGCLSMARSDGYKLVAVGTGEEGEGHIFARRGFADHSLAVFDLKSDPYEYVNLFKTEQGREVLSWGVETHNELKGPGQPGRVIAGSRRQGR